MVQELRNNSAPAVGRKEAYAMQIDEKDITIAGFVLTWLAGIFGFGRAYEALSGKVAKHETAIKELQENFVTVDGEPRFVSYMAHDKMQAACQGLMRQRLDSIDDRMNTHDEKLDKLLEGVSSLQGRNHDR
jgi:hypothetical protein